MANGYGRGRIQTVQYDYIVTVQSENDPPVLRPVISTVAMAGDSLGLALQTFDIDQETLQYSVVGLPDEAWIEDSVRYGEAILNWNPTVDDLGSYEVTVNVTDSGNGRAGAELSDESTFTIHVRDFNQSPLLDDSVATTQFVDEGQSIELAFSATDADGDAIAYLAESLPAGASLDAVTGQFHWTPSFDDSGVHTFEITASDGADSDTRTYSVDVQDVNRAPRLAFPAPQYAREGVFMEFTVTGGDYDGGALDLSAIDLPSGALFDPSTGVFRWRPQYDQAGRYDVTFTLTDQQSAADSITVPITVDNVNRVPVIESRHHQVVVGQLLDFQIAGTDPDSDDTLCFSAYGLPEGARVNPQNGAGHLDSRSRSTWPVRVGCSDQRWFSRNQTHDRDQQCRDAAVARRPDRHHAQFARTAGDSVFKFM